MSWSLAKLNAELLRRLRVRRWVFTEPSLDENQRVLQLFQNRADIKRAYAELQTEIYQARDRVKQQEGVSRRLQEELAALEARLADPLQGQRMLVSYQLRDIWKTGGWRVTTLVGELAAQHEERERRDYLAAFNRGLFEQQQSMQIELAEAEQSVAEQRGRLAELSRARVRADVWWRFFDRQSLDTEMAAQEILAQGAQRRLQQLRSKLEQLKSGSGPQFPGLKLESRRAINITAIAYAEVLALRLARTGLMERVREACRRAEPIESYGDIDGCHKLMNEIAVVREVLVRSAAVAEEIRLRALRLQAQVRYRSEQDAIPTEESAQGPMQPGDLQQAPPVLRDDWWDLNNALLR
jgi:hypothetical protein